VLHVHVTVLVCSMSTTMCWCAPCPRDCAGLLHVHVTVLVLLQGCCCCEDASLLGSITSLKLPASNYQPQTTSLTSIKLPASPASNYQHQTTSIKLPASPASNYQPQSRDQLDPASRAPKTQRGCCPSRHTPFIESVAVQCCPEIFP